jgi:hypothetical protein
MNVWRISRDGLVGAALLRVSLALIILVGYLWTVPIFNQLYGNRGPLSYTSYLSYAHPGVFDLYRFLPNPIAIKCFFIVSVVVALLFLLGLGLPWMAPVFFVTLISNTDRLMLDTDGGRELLVLMAFLLCFTDSGRYLSISSARRRRARGITGYARAIVHQCAYFLMKWQVCMVYVWAVFYKLGGAQWRDGTALAYTLQANHFMIIPHAAELISRNSIAVALATYGTLAFQMAFPFLMWNHRAKPVIVGVAVTLHTGIAIFLGLISFSATMIACDIAILSDRQLLSFSRLCIRLLRSMAPRTSHFLNPNPRRIS